MLKQLLFRILVVSTLTFIYRVSKSASRQFAVVVMLLPSYQLVIWKKGGKFGAASVGVLQDNLVLSTELMTLATVI